MNDSPHIFSVDHIRMAGRFMQVAGWATRAAQAEHVTITFPDGTRDHVPRAFWNRPSPDVAAGFGADYSDARFEIPIGFPSVLSPHFFARTRISFHEDGQSDSFALLRPDQLPAGFTDRLDGPEAERDIFSLRLGIGIPTYNRSGLLRQTLAAVRALTSVTPTIFVADDGSQDDTASVLASEQGLSYVSAPNRGIAWNKNRALFYLKEVARCDIIILIEDDVVPTAWGWERDWMLASLLYGHVNFAPEWWTASTRGNGSWHAPVESDVLTAQCSAFTNEAVSYVGYIDARFGKYGHEHVEHTNRLIRMGYGGHLHDDGVSRRYFLLSGNLSLRDSLSNHSADEVSRNHDVLMQIQNEFSYRTPWRGEDADIALFRDEMRLVRHV
ncbi:hypothetical protein AA103196_1393 [Ameyamaea chiangmaiensis NBRC 103196]|uniref:Glycosyltransferase n=1 Tax=Ameyamaea chiangmaiensis TaxID=442969 RepID=A0A850PCA5_9PROT|nr:glycosyltransferase [Ameyamaea chiangmaiensis]MBS4075215.1 glycosyltransferase [Ameyamaea chiangmaiensis]NVN41754.1 glycosyltransferase [Ameyamaea chiangmaiensis]GBQ66428.1 hypothetical protein AA103196_1393 [Ameyamaea chiangmaiensis NBRC 103196]